MNRAYWESRFYDENYWARYLNLLARNRFNSLVVIFGYENGGFLAPCYPYFFDVPEFPGVRMVGITPQQQQRNLEALKRLIQMAHDRGLRFTVGIWDHIYRGGVQSGGVAGMGRVPAQPTPGLVWGVTADNLLPYTTAALTKFVRLVPEVDAIQFRMHDESGLRPGEQQQFWHEVFQVMKQHRTARPLRRPRQGTAGRRDRQRTGAGREPADHDQILDGADGHAVSSHAHQSPGPVQPPARLRRPAPLSAAL